MENDMDPRGMQNRILINIARGKAVQIHTLRSLGYTAKLKVAEALTQAGVTFDRCIVAGTVGRSIWSGTKETLSDFDIVVLLNQPVGNTVSPFATALANIKKAVCDVEAQDQSLLFDKEHHDSVQVKLKALNGARNFVTFEIVPAFSFVPASPAKDFQVATTQQERVLKRIAESKDISYACKLYGSSLLEVLQNFMQGLDMYGAYHVHNVFTLCKHWDKVKIGNDPKLKNFRSRFLMIELAAIRAIEVYEAQREQRRQKWLQIQDAQRARRNAVKSQNGGFHVSAGGGQGTNSVSDVQNNTHKTISDFPLRQDGGGNFGTLKQNENKRRAPVKLLNTFQNFLEILVQQRSQVHITFELKLGEDNQVYHRQFSIMRNSIGVILNPVNPFHNLLDEVGPEEWAVYRKAARASLDILDDYRTTPEGIKLSSHNCF